jgi:hopene-associated glycosyltransferase HpnB
MLAAISILSFAAWVYLVAFRGLFWRSVPVLPRQTPSSRSKVVAIIPARDEAASIQQSIGSLVAQDYSGELSIILVDDNSTDGTAEIAASLPTDNLTIISGAPLPPGWTGKLWAINQGLAHEKAKSADYVFLTDADIEHAPGHLSALVGKAEAENSDLVSEMVRLNCTTKAERAFIPAFVFFFQMLYPFAWVADPARRLAGAAGGAMLIRRAALDRIGGVSRIHNHLIDDCALAKEIKASGGSIWLGHAELAASKRVYSDISEVWNMIARTAYEQLGYSPLILLGCVMAMGIIYCAPPLLALCTQGTPRVFGLLSWMMMAGAFQPTLRRYRQLPLWGFALPLIGLFYLCATIASAVRFHSGRGGGWKDRVYPENAGIS